MSIYPLTVDARVLAVIACQTAATPRIEAGGFLGGDNSGHIGDVWPVANRSPKPYCEFKCADDDYRGAAERFEAGGLFLVGGYHSHPTGSPMPSRDDWRTAEGLGVMLIVGLEHWEWRFWCPALSEKPVDWLVVPPTHRGHEG
jgi:proteasome lid subunit RPN8/RPN11